MECSCVKTGTLRSSLVRLLIDVLKNLGEVALECKVLLSVGSGVPFRQMRRAYMHRRDSMEERNRHPSSRFTTVLCDLDCECVSMGERGMMRSTRGRKRVSRVVDSRKVNSYSAGNRYYYIIF